MQIFSPMGHFIRRIPIRFIDIVAGLAISREGTFLLIHKKILGFGLKLPENFNFLLQHKAIDIIAHFDLTRKFM